MFNFPPVCRLISISDEADDCCVVCKFHLAPKPLGIAERFRFHKRNQGEEETVAQYVAVLKRLSEYCEFGAYLEDALRDRFVCGLKSETVQKRLLTEKDLTFHKAVEYAVSAETATRDVQQLSLKCMQ